MSEKMGAVSPKSVLGLTFIEVLCKEDCLSAGWTGVRHNRYRATSPTASSKCGTCDIRFDGAKVVAQLLHRYGVLRIEFG